MIITTDNYQEALKTDKILILDFATKACVPCVILKAILEEIESENENITIGTVYIEDNQDIAIKFGIMSVPSMVIIKDGKLIKKISGLKEKSYIEKILKKL